MLKYLLNLQYVIKKEIGRIDNYFKAALNIINKNLKISEQRFFEISLIDDKQMQIINKKYRKINKPTDVLSFVFDDGRSIKTILMGEIFIDVQQAKRQSLDGNLYSELTLLFIHGVLHLLGYDHANVKQEKNMFSLQNKIMKQLNLLR
jgi:probable rRNA maturation factor